MSLKEKIINKLTDAYNKNPESNIGKVIGVMISEFEELKSTLERIESWRNIDNAEGEALDDIGVDINQYRGKTNDEIYRVLLKSKRARDLSEGDTNTIINIIAMSLDAKKEDIEIVETWMEDNPEPNGVRILDIPISKINESGMSPEQFVQLIRTAVAAGVAVKTIELSGTFEYGAVGEDQDENRGFADIEQEAGGYYGAIVKSEDDYDLPV